MGERPPSHHRESPKRSDITMKIIVRGARPARSIWAGLSQLQGCDAQRGHASGHILHHRCATSLGVHLSAGYRLVPMRHSKIRIVSLGVLAASLVALPGCASLGGGGGGDSAETAYVARDVETLYSAAKARLDRGDLSVAAALFDEVERQHPYSPWARQIGRAHV